MTVTVIGFVAAFFTAFATLPQTIKVIRTKKTKDISLPTFLLLAVGVFLWVIYGLIKRDVPIVIANTLTFLCVMPIIVAKLKHK